jgi:hypothetical protein
MKIILLLFTTVVVNEVILNTFDLCYLLLDVVPLNTFPFLFFIWVLWQIFYPDPIGHQSDRGFKLRNQWLNE